MWLKYSQVILLAVLVTLPAKEVLSNENGDYKVGVGIADVTGPAAELGMVK